MVAKGKGADGRRDAGGPRRGTPECRRGASQRYTASEKLALLEEHAGSGLSMREFCARRGISTATLCKWRKAHRYGGAAGLEPRENPRHGGKVRGAYPVEERIRAVEAFLKSELTRADFARTWGMSVKTLSIWVRRYEESGPEGLERPRRAKRRKALSPGPVPLDVILSDGRHEMGVDIALSRKPAGILSMVSLREQLRSSPSRAGVLIIGLIGLACLELINPRIERSQQPVKEETEYDTEWGDGPAIAAIPDGEWWGVARDFVTVVEINKLRGHAALFLKDKDLIFSVELAHKKIKLWKVDPETGQRTYFTIPDDDKLQYTLTRSNIVVFWDATVPEFRHDGSECLDLDQILVVRTTGALGRNQPSFRLNWSKLNDPMKRCTPLDARHIVRLRKLIAANK